MSKTSNCQHTDNSELVKPQCSASDNGDTLTVYLLVRESRVSPIEWRHFPGQMKKFKRVRITKLVTKTQANNPEDDLGTSTLVGRGDINEKTTVAVFWTNRTARMHAVGLPSSVG